ncbi:hypothetical protein QBC39DRAFT_295209 [Podospora conica]|nr:hypothetical protein QBC39DRAFT_295209 [Schizothecium conicum]
MSSAQAPVGGFSLFPNTSRPPSRSQSRPRAVTPVGRPGSTEPSPPRVGRRASVRRGSSATREERPREERPREERRRMAPSNNPWQHALDNPLSRDDEEQSQQQPQHQPQHQHQHQHQQQHQQQPPSQQPPQQPQQRAQPQQYQPEPQPHALSVDTSVMNRPREYPSAISASDVPPRCETALSDARTLVRSPSVSSISKPPLVYDPRDRGGGVGASGSNSAAPVVDPPIRSMFPQYNPELPLDRQEYFPTQTSPVHIPQSAISRAMYSPRSPEAAAAPIRQAATTTPAHPVASARSPSAASNHHHRFHTTSAATTPQRAPHHAHHHEPRAPPPVSTTEDLRSLWKVTNGWKASSLEGRIFCLKMTTQPDCPVYTLSSSSAQPFYSLRIDPTSASAYVSLSRFDPTKPFKGSKPGAATSPSPSPTPSSPRSSSGTPPATTPSRADLKHDAKHWHPVLATQLEPAARHQPPNDGLVAQLWPAAAARLAADRANDAATVALAEHECARLVWDADSSAHFLVHPALAVPFCVTVDRHPAYARTEYTLEHLESPVHLGRLTRDGTGAGYLEVDTSIAGKIDAVYLVDVVVAALVLVAHADEEWREVETFEPPPASVFNGVEGGGGHKRGSRRSSRASRRGQQQDLEAGSTRRGKASSSRLEQFEMDIESQTSELKKGGKGEKDKVPGVARGIIALITVLFKCVIWCFTLVFRALTGLVRCLSSDKI